MNSDKTMVMAEFNVLGDQFPLEAVTVYLDITPTESYRKGDIIRNNLSRKETCWCVSTVFATP